MKTSLKFLGIALVSFGILSCVDSKKEVSSNNEETIEEVIVKPIKSVLTAEEQASMTPNEIIERLKKGNENFVNNSLIQRDHSEQRRIAAIGQYPKAIVLSCVDSRVPVEDVFDLGIGDIFVARVAGNIENRDIVGSMEFASAVASSKVVIVMGHTACGAVMHAIDNTDAASMNMHALHDLLTEIKPAVELTEKNGDVSSKNVDFSNSVINNNAIKTVDDIRKMSPVMSSLEAEGKIKIIAAVYDMETGKVNFME